MPKCWEEELFADLKIIPKWKAEHAAKSELVGIQESDDISSMLPAEAALLSSGRTEALFYKKFAEKKLQTFEYQAKIFSYEEEQFQNKRQKARLLYALIPAVPCTERLKQLQKHFTLPF